MNRLKYIKPENLSGYVPKNLSKLITTIRKRNFKIEDDFSVGGDAPKDFIRVYRYGQVRRKNRSKWIGYIAKTGHKWYPNESITEHLLNCIGRELGLYMSESELAIIGGQLRFLSKYFLSNQHQELVHGVDIFAGFISDREFVEEIEQQQLAREFFTFQFAIKAIEFAFPENYEEIILGFVELLVFDAIVGNNDRHFYNWGVIKNIQNIRKPYFSPIFDTARGLFWNDSEKKIVERVRQKDQLELYLKKYIKNSFPKTGWEDEKDLNHIELIKRIREYDENYSRIIDELLTKEKEQRILEMINSKFSGLVSVNRLFIIVECLKFRFEELRNKK